MLARFVTEGGADMQTHNVVATIPDDVGYSPLWNVQVYDNANFGSVANLSSALEADQLGANVATVNCPIVDVRSSR